MTVYSLGKNTQVFDTLQKDTEKYRLSYRHKNISQEEKVNDPYCSSLFVLDDLSMQLMSSKTFLAHMTSVPQHGIQVVMLTQNFSGKDKFSTINMNLDNILLMSLVGVSTRLKSFLHEKSKYQSNQVQSSAILNQMYRVMCVAHEQVGNINTNETDHVYISCHTRTENSPISKFRTRLGNRERQDSLLEKMNGTYDPVSAMREKGQAEYGGDHFPILIGLEKAFTLTADKSSLSLSPSHLKEKIIAGVTDVQDQEDGRNSNVREEEGKEANINKKIIKSSHRSDDEAKLGQQSHAIPKCQSFSDGCVSNNYLIECSY